MSPQSLMIGRLAPVLRNKLSCVRQKEKSANHRGRPAAALKMWVRLAYRISKCETHSQFGLLFLGYLRHCKVILLINTSILHNVRRSNSLVRHRLTHKWDSLSRSVVKEPLGLPYFVCPCYEESSFCPDWNMLMMSQFLDHFSARIRTFANISLLLIFRAGGDTATPVIA